MQNQQNKKEIAVSSQGICAALRVYIHPNSSAAQQQQQQQLLLLLMLMLMETFACSN